MCHATFSEGGRITLVRYVKNHSKPIKSLMKRFINSLTLQTEPACGSFTPKRAELLIVCARVVKLFRGGKKYVNFFHNFFLASGGTGREKNELKISS